MLGGTVDTHLTFNVDGSGVLQEKHITVHGPDNIVCVNESNKRRGSAR